MVNVPDYIKYFEKSQYSGADKSLARPGRKQAPEAEDFDFHIFCL